MPSEVFAVYNLAKPFLHHRGIDIIIVNPFLIASVVRRIDVDAFDFTGVEGKQRFEGLQVIPMDNEIVMEADLVSQALVLFWNQLMVLNKQMMVLNKRFTLKLNLRHIKSSFSRSTPYSYSVKIGLHFLKM